MKMENEHHLPLERGTVWRALNDPEVLRACIPGCESFERVDENTYDALVHQKIGPVKARFKGRVSLTDVHPPASYTLSFHGQGGQAGFVKGSADVRLDDTDGGCRLGYTAKATLGGKLAQLGSRLVDSAARKNANDFFASFVRHMGVAEEAGAAEQGGGAEGREAAAPGAPAGAASRVWPWLVGAAIVIAIAAAVALA